MYARTRTTSAVDADLTDPSAYDTDLTGDDEPDATAASVTVDVHFRGAKRCSGMIDEDDFTTTR